MNKVLLVIILTLVIVGVFVAVYKPWQISKHPQTTTPTTTLEPSAITKTPIPGITRTSPAILGKEEQIKLEFHLTGSVILPNFKAAFILNTLTKQEQMYQEKSSLYSKDYGVWIVYNIASSEVVLHQYHQDGSIAMEYVLKVTKKPIDEPQIDEPETGGITRTFKPGEKNPEQSNPDNINAASPEQLDKMSINEIMPLIKTIPESLIQTVLNTVPQDYLKQRLMESPLDVAITPGLFATYKPADILNILRKTAEDFTSKGENLILFSLVVNPDNSPISPTNAFPAEKKVYACFKNEGVMAKLNPVIVKWANLSTTQIVYWRAFMINPEAQWNYVFLRPEKKWETGKYLVTIYKQVQDTTPIAYGEFEIK